MFTNIKIRNIFAFCRDFVQNNILTNTNYWVCLYKRNWCFFLIEKVCFISDWSIKLEFVWRSARYYWHSEIAGYCLWRSNTIYDVIEYNIHVQYIAEHMEITVQFDSIAYFFLSSAFSRSKFIIDCNFW